MKYDYDGESAVIVKGSAAAALGIGVQESEYSMKEIAELLDAMDEHLPEAERDHQKPFLLSVESIFNIAGRGTVVTGTVEFGKAKPQDSVEIVGI